MDKKEFQEAIHEEIGVSINAIAKSLRKEKKKPDYVYLAIFSSSMLYFLYLMYQITKTIHL